MSYSWQANNLRAKALVLPVPFIATLVTGALLLEVAYDLSLQLQLVSIWMTFFGACLLSYAMAWRLTNIAWIKSSIFRLRFAWGLSAFICVVSLVAAVREHRIVRNPDTWLEVRVIPQELPFEVSAGEVYYAIEVAPESSAAIEKVENKTSVALHWPMLESDESNGRSAFGGPNIGYVYEIRNSGIKTLFNIELLLPISYSHAHQADLSPLPRAKKARVTIDSLVPGEIFPLIVYSKPSTFYADVDLPKTAQAKFSSDRLTGTLRVNHVTKKHDFPFTNVTVGGGMDLPAETATRTGVDYRD